MVYFTDDENEELASLKRQFDVDILDADEYKDAKAVILEAAKKRRTGDVRPAPKPEPAAAPAAAPASATVTSTNSSATTPTAMGHAKLFATTSSSSRSSIGTSSATSSSQSATDKTSLAYFFAIKAVNKCKTGYAKHWNETHVNLVRYSRGSKQMRNNEVDRLWNVRKQASALATEFQKKGGAEAAWKRGKKDLERSLSSGPNGSRGPFFETKRRVIVGFLETARRDIVRRRRRRGPR